MALVLSGELEQEVNRINSSKDSFSVLQVHPTMCTPLDIQKNFGRLSKIFKNPASFRSKEAMKAKAKLDKARATLSNTESLKKERASYLEEFGKVRDEKEDMNAVRERTLQLEEIVRNMKAMQEQQGQGGGCTVPASQN